MQWIIFDLFDGKAEVAIYQMFRGGAKLQIPSGVWW
jgi:hypothetical protein